MLGSGAGQESTVYQPDHLMVEAVPQSAGSGLEAAESPDRRQLLK